MPFHLQTAAPAAVLAIATLALPPVNAAADVIYDSYSPLGRGYWFIHDQGEVSSAIELPGGSENESQAGNLIVLAGSARQLSDVQIRLRGFGFFFDGTSADVSLRLWTAEGDQPGDLLWSGSQNVAIPSGFNPLAEVAFSPGITVPDTLIWTFALDNIINPRDLITRLGAGLLPEDPAIGSGSGGVLWQDSTTLLWLTENLTFPQNLEARFTAVPTPSTCLLALALGGYALRRHRG